MKRMKRASRQRWDRLVRRFRGQRVAVIGDVMLDRFVRGRASRLSPEAPVPVIEVDSLDGTPHPGGAANVAANLCSLGARPVLLGVVGRDEAARALAGELKRLGVRETELLADPSRPTTVKVRIASGQWQIVRVDREQRTPLRRAVEKKLLARLARVLPQVRAVVVSDYDKGLLTDTVLEAILRSSRARKLPTFVDLKRWRELELPATLILVNERRAAEMTHREIRDAASARAVGQQLRERLGCHYLVMTRGGQGMMIVDRELAPVRDVESRPWEIFDVTGAGDTVLATLALAFLAGADPEEAAELSNHAAGIVVSKRGTATCTPAELLASLRQADAEGGR